MALHNLKITVIDGGRASGVGTGGKGSEDTKKPGGKDSALYKVLNLNSEIKDAAKQALSPAAFFALQSGIGLAKQTARQFINYYVTDIGRRHGDSNLQSQIGRRIEQVTDGLSIAGGFFGGLASGSMFGPVGAVIGAIVGTVGAGVNMGFKYAGRERAYAHEMFEESNSQATRIARANYSIYTGRVR